MRVVLASASEAAAEAAVEATDIVLPPTHRTPIVGGTLEAVGYAYEGRVRFCFECFEGSGVPNFGTAT
jgi:hypothetical protein